MTTAHDILLKAGDHMRDRAKTYDKPEGERSMAATVEAFRAITGITLTESQGWAFMAILKMVRASSGGEFRLDNFEDGAAYFGLMGEAAEATVPPQAYASGGLVGKPEAALRFGEARPDRAVHRSCLLHSSRPPLKDINGNDMHAVVNRYDDMARLLHRMGWGLVVNNGVPQGYQAFQDFAGAWWCGPSKAVDPPEEFRFKAPDKL